MGEWLDPWTIEPCDLCGCEHTLTRMEGRERQAEELCEGCSERDEGFAEGLAQGAAAERARIVAWLRSRTAGGHGGWYAYIADRIETDMPEQPVLHASGNGDRTDNGQPEQGEGGVRDEG